MSKVGTAQMMKGMPVFMGLLLTNFRQKLSRNSDTNLLLITVFLRLLTADCILKDYEKMRLLRALIFS